MSLDRISPILNVTDLGGSISWFEQFGWLKQWTHGEPATFGSVTCGSSEILLRAMSQSTAASGWYANAGDVWMCWWLRTPRDVDEMHSRALQLRAEVSMAPVDMPWGAREFHLRHPDGHTMRICANLH